MASVDRNPNLVTEIRSLRFRISQAEPLRVPRECPPHLGVGQLTAIDDGQ